MAAEYIEYKAGTWTRRRMATRTGVVAAVIALFVVTGAIRFLSHAVFFIWFVVVAIAVVIGESGLADRPVYVRLTSKGVEQYFSRSKYSYVAWSDVASVDVGWELFRSTKHEYPLLVLKDGQRVRVSAILSPAKGAVPPATYFGAIPHDPRFEEKVSEMRRLLAEARDLEWSDEPALDRPDQDVQPGATNPDS